MGHIGHIHAKVYQSHPKVRLIGVCDRQEDRAREAERAFGVPAYLDAQTMLDEQSLTWSASRRAASSIPATTMSRPSRRFTLVRMSYAKSRSATIWPKPRKWSGLPGSAIYAWQ
jgi:predicted dinucleotide-utilizing enzyme